MRLLKDFFHEKLHFYVFFNHIVIFPHFWKKHLFGSSKTVQKDAQRTPRCPPGANFGGFLAPRGAPGGPLGVFLKRFWGTKQLFFRPSEKTPVLELSWGSFWSPFGAPWTLMWALGHLISSQKRKTCFRIFTHTYLKTLTTHVFGFAFEVCLVQHDLIHQESHY